MNDPIMLIPLDERPVNTRYPQMLGEIGGVAVVLPPEEIRGLARTGADLGAVDAWMRKTLDSGIAAAVVSCDYLAFGNLINARISTDTAITAIGRLGVLAQINTKRPVHAFSIVTRVANADDGAEEPLYWRQWGTQFYRWALLTHKREAAALSDEECKELSALDETLPGDMRADWLTRRLRNHTVNLALLDMAARGEIASLALASDDTAPYGLSSRERTWLLGWERLIGSSLRERVQAYPGADEVGSALIARVINAQRGLAPRVWIEYAIAGHERIVARYEDRPVEQTVLGQILACNCRVAPSPEDSDFVLGVATPSPRQRDYQPQFEVEDRQDRTDAYESFLACLAAHQSAGRPVALADVAYPNGADPLLAELLLSGKSAIDCGSLAAYGAWNTAGNTLGVVVAQAALAIYASTPNQQSAQRLFLTHRFLEDCGYQGGVRRQARAEARRLWGKPDPDPDCIAGQREISSFIEDKLRQFLCELQHAGVGAGVEIVPCSTRLPWRRLFEVDFDVAHVRF